MIKINIKYNTQPDTSLSKATTTKTTSVKMSLTVIIALRYLKLHKITLSK